MGIGKAPSIGAADTDVTPVKKIENIRYGSIEHKGIRLHLFDSIKFVFPKIAIA